MGYSRNLDDFDVDGTWPKLEFTNQRRQDARSLMTNMTHRRRGQARRRRSLRRRLQCSRSTKFTFDGADEEKSKSTTLHYVVDQRRPRAFIGHGREAGHRAKSRRRRCPRWHRDQGSALRLLGAAPACRDARETDSQHQGGVCQAGRPTRLEADRIMFAPFKEHGIGVLKHDPEFVIDRIGIVTPEGEGYIKGVIQLKGATEADFGTGSMSLIGKVEADITIDVAEKLIEKFPDGATGAGAAVERVLPEREGERLVSHIVFNGRRAHRSTANPRQFRDLAARRARSGDGGGPPPAGVESATSHHGLTQGHPRRHRIARDSQWREVRDPAGLHRHQGRSEAARRRTRRRHRAQAARGSARSCRWAPGSAR